MVFKSPNKSQWKKLQGGFPFENLDILESDFPYTINPSGSFESFTSSQEIDTWSRHLTNRLYQVRWCYVLSMFQFEKGIPDDEWYISPGRNGQSIEYFPHFTRDDHLTKAQFDFHADVFYYKLFSAWDTLGHLLDVMYELAINKASFDKAVGRLKRIRPLLFCELSALKNSDKFKEMVRLRHAATHNLLPGHTGPIVNRVSPSHVTLGVGSYTPTARIKENMHDSLELFVEALEAIRRQATLDLSP